MVTKHVRCPTCDGTFDISSNNLGKRLACPLCRAVFSFRQAHLIEQRAPRVEANLPCLIENRPATVVDISRTGLQIELTEPAHFPETETVSLDLSLKNAPLKVKAKVVRKVSANPHRWALQIITIDGVD